mmetsp:Transcript_21649/g.45713  ORF Transcript_21649/g.45713 Transcript_21649/m.45713 type:complete len:542 (+) Transcript_21649:93-1718(+)
MRRSLILKVLIILSPSRTRIPKRQAFVIEGLFLPFQQLNSARGLLLAKNTFSNKRRERDFLLKCAAHHEITIPNGDDSAQPHGRGMTKRGDHKTEIMAGTLNLIKAMAGTGILALPMGVAKSSDFRISIIPAITLMSILGAISTYTFTLYGRLVHVSKAKTLGELWEKTMDKNSAWLVSAVSLTFCFGACLSYSLCLGDVSSSLAKTIGLTGVWTSRKFCIIFLTTAILYPLCNLRSLISLAPLSLAGVGAVLVTAIFIGWRCPFVYQRSPYNVAGVGHLLATLSPEQLPKFQSHNKGFLNSSSLILFGMAASAYLGHFTAPDLYHSLEMKGHDFEDGAPSSMVDSEKSDGNDRVYRSDVLNSFLRVSLGGFLSTTMINCSIMTFGFLTFGGNAMGVILNNFSTFDKGATVCRFLTAVSVLGGYPFLIRACRGEILELYKLQTNRKPSRKDEKTTTAILLLSLTVASMLISDAGLIIGLAGAVMGSALVYIFPSLMYLSTTNKMNELKTRRIKLERMLCRSLVVFGTFAAVAGVCTLIFGL